MVTIFFFRVIFNMQGERTSSVVYDKFVDEDYIRIFFSSHLFTSFIIILLHNIFARCEIYEVERKIWNFINDIRTFLI